MKSFLLLLAILAGTNAHAAEKKITDLTLLPAASYDTADVLAIVDVSANQTKKTRILDLDGRYVSAGALSPNVVLVTDASGTIAGQAQLDRTKGGTGISSTATFPSSGVVVTRDAVETLTNKTMSGASNTFSNVGYSSLLLSNSIVNADVNASAAIAYPKLDLLGSVTNADLAGGIAYGKLVLSNSIVNADVNASAAIAYPKLNLVGSVTNADLAGSIAYGKLVLSNSIVNADVATGAAVDYSKLALSNSIVNADVNASAAIAYPKLDLVGSVTNADLAGGIAYGKLVLSNSIVNADVNASAAIAYPKLDLLGSVTNADLAGSIAYGKLVLSNSIVNADVATGAAIDYAKLSLSNSIVNADVNASAAIAYPKLNLVGSVTNADLAGSIAYSKLVLSNSVVNADVATGAAIDYSKLNLSGSVTNSDLAGSIAYNKLTLTNSIVNADIASGAAIVDTKLDTISTALKVSNSATTATSANTALAIVARDGSGDFTAGTITATLNGNASNITGVAAIANGGTGASNASAAVNAILPPQGGQSGKYLTTNGTNPSWATVAGAGFTDSAIRLDTPNGFGSTNTKIRRLTGTVSTTGSDLSYADTASAGTSITVNTSGVYAFSYSEEGSSGSPVFGLSLNSANLTSDVNGLPSSELLILSSVGSGNERQALTWVGYLTAGDVVRPHTNEGTATFVSANITTLTAARVH